MARDDPPARAPIFLPAAGELAVFQTRRRPGDGRPDELVVQPGPAGRLHGSVPAVLPSTMREFEDAQAPPPVAPNRPRRRWPWVALIVGCAVAGIGVVGALWNGVSYLQDAAVLRVPDSRVVHLEEGDHLVFAAEGTTGSIGLEVESATGSGRVPYRRHVGDSATISVGDETFDPIGSLDVPRTGDWVVRTSGAGGRVAIGRSIGSLAGSVAIWLGLVAFPGVIAAVVGFVALLFRRPRRVRLPKAVGAYAGWYLDTEALGMLRYWDGTAWTHHRATLPSELRDLTT